MNPKLFFCLLLLTGLLVSPDLFGQSRIVKKLERKAKQKLEQRAERKVDKAMDKGLDKVEDAIDKSAQKKSSKKKTASDSSSDSATATESKSTSQRENENPSENMGQQPDTDTPNILQKKAPESPEPFEQTNFGHETLRDKGIMGKGPYGLESGMFIQITRTHHEMMESVVRDTVYFDRFGQLQARKQMSEQQINMMGIKRKEKSRLIAIHRNDSIYSYNPEKRSGHVMENPAREFYQGMSEKDLQKFAEGIQDGMNTTQKRLGTDRVAGKLCEVMEFTSHTEEGEVMMITRIWWWKGMTLKSLSRGMGSEIEQEVTLIKDNIQIEPHIFRPNPRIKYRSFSLGEY